MKASSTAARSHGPADPGSFDAVPATTLRLRSALRPSAPSSPRLTRWPWGRNDPHRRPRTSAQAFLLAGRRERPPRCVLRVGGEECQVQSNGSG